MKVKDAKAIALISTRNGKMPGTTFAIDAFACKTGSKLAAIPGTPCHSCYARKLQKMRPSADKGWKDNLTKWKRASPEQWEQAVAFQIIRYNSDGYHRWFDSGDLQSVGMLRSIVNVCLMTPQVRHWLPTQERGIVSRWMAEGGVVPDNLVIRVSAVRIDTVQEGRWTHTSNVISKDGAPTGSLCEARSRGNVCGPCRACWSPEIKNISYPKH